jgi:uncharacterized protein (TIGR03083 family)
MTHAPTSTTLITTVPAIGHAEAMRLQAVELQRNLDLMHALAPDDWTARTECPDWDVRLLYAHVLGACESGASMREFARQFMAARSFQKARGGPQEAALSAVQVAARRSLTPAEITTRFTAVAPRTVRGRTRLPSLLRRAPIKVDGPVAETWTLGYLVDVIYLRDAWMHRVDVSRATGRDLTLDAGHDGRIVADVAAEWGRRHGRPFTLVLTGPAGGTFLSASGAGGPEITMDAVEFCRVLAGRAPATHELLETIVPF